MTAPNNSFSDRNSAVYQRLQTALSAREHSPSICDATKLFLWYQTVEAQRELKKKMKIMMETPPQKCEPTTPTENPSTNGEEKEETPSGEGSAIPFLVLESTATSLKHQCECESRNAYCAFRDRESKKIVASRDVAFGKKTGEEGVQFVEESARRFISSHFVGTQRQHSIPCFIEFVMRFGTEKQKQDLLWSSGALGENESRQIAEMLPFMPSVNHVRCGSGYDGYVLMSHLDHSPHVTKFTAITTKRDLFTTPRNGGFRNITWLHLTLDSSDFHTLRSIVEHKHFPNLEELVLEDLTKRTCITPDNIEDLMGVFPHMPELRRLQVPIINPPGPTQAENAGAKEVLAKVFSKALSVEEVLKRVKTAFLQRARNYGINVQLAGPTNVAEALNTIFFVDNAPGQEQPPLIERCLLEDITIDALLPTTARNERGISKISDCPLSVLRPNEVLTKITQQAHLMICLQRLNLERCLSGDEVVTLFNGLSDSKTDAKKRTAAVAPATRCGQNEEATELSFPNLEQLSVAYSDLNERALTAISSCSRLSAKGSKVTVLDVRGASAAPAAIKQFVEPFYSSDGGSYSWAIMLRELRINPSNIGQEELARVLRRNKQLKEEHQ